MPSGGARPNSGPPPNPSSATSARNAADWMTIRQRNGVDENGVAFDIPSWPAVLGHPLQEQQELWEQLWLNQPQAVIWEREQMQLQVATYVLAFLDYTTGRHAMSPERGGLVARLAADILMTPAALRSARVVVAGTADAAAIASAQASSASRAVRGSRAGRAGLSVVKAEGA